MATHKSAEKRARQAVRKTNFNSITKAALRTVEKKLRAAVGEKKAKEAQEILKTLASKFDKAASKGVLHARTASRKVARLSSLVSSLGK